MRTAYTGSCFRKNSITKGINCLESRVFYISELRTNTNAINIFAGTVGCVPRTHRLIGVIGDHALQDRNRTKYVCINNSELLG